MSDNATQREPTEEAIQRAAQVKARAHYYDDLVGFGWMAIARSIIFAGGAYPLAIAASYLCISVVVLLINLSALPSIDPSAPFLILFATAAFGLAGVFVGLIWASMVTLVTLPVIHLVVWSLRLQPNWIKLGAFSGGLVAFLSVLPLAIRIPAMFQFQSDMEPFIALCLGPCLATVVGQIGGARGGREATWRLTEIVEWRRSLIAREWSASIAEYSNDVDDLPPDPDGPRFRFRTVHLLWLGLWLSLLLTVIRLSGIPYGLILPVLVGWLVFQAATLAIGWLLARHLGPWWHARRKIRST